MYVYESYRMLHVINLARDWPMDNNVTTNFILFYLCSCYYKANFRLKTGTSISLDVDKSNDPMQGCFHECPQSAVVLSAV